MVRDPRRALSGFLVFLLLVSSAGLTACRKKDQPAPAEHAGGHAAAPAAAQEPGMPMEAGTETPAVPAGSVQVSADRQQFLGVVVTPVDKRSRAREIRTVGRVEYDERKLAFVKLKIMVPLTILLIVLLLYLNFRSLLQTFSGSADPFSMWRERQDWRHCVMRISIGR